jgi:hypothetical protein
MEGCRHVRFLEGSVIPGTSTQLYSEVATGEEGFLRAGVDGDVDLLTDHFPLTAKIEAAEIDEKLPSSSSNRNEWKT